MVTGARPRAAFAPQRFIPAEILAACDAWLALAPFGDAEPDIALVCRRAIWALYRYSGVRLAELAWAIETGLPRIEVEHDQCWTLYVNGKGQKLRAVPLPTVCIDLLCKYRVVRGLSAAPKGHE